MKRRAVLFDVGGPIDMEVDWEAMMDRLIRAEVAAATGAPVPDDAYAAAWEAAIASHAPNAYQAVLWNLMGEDEARAPLASALAAAEAAAARGSSEPGVEAA